MLETLRRIVQEVNAAPDLDAVLAIIVRRVREAMGTEVCSVFLVDAATQRLVFRATEGLNAEMVGRLSLAPSEGLVGLVALRAEPINLEDAQHHPNYHYLAEIGEEPFNAFLGVPIIHHRRILGVLVVQQQAARRFDESDEAILVTLSAQLAGVIAHAEATGGAGTTPGLHCSGSERPDARFAGVPGAPGVAIGTGVVLFAPANLDAVPDRDAEDVSVELQLLERALGAVRGEIRALGEKLASSLDPQERMLFDAYLHMLDDAALGGEIRRRISTGQWAQGALRQVIAEHVSHFELMEDSYLRERAADVKELGQRVLANLQEVVRPRSHFPERTIIVGEEITPSMLGEVPAERLAGIVSMKGSANSHIAILARAMGVPTVMGAATVPYSSMQGREVIVDGFHGDVYLNPSRTLREHYETVRSEEEEFFVGLAELKDEPAATRDGHRIALCVNIGLSADAERSLQHGAEGVGLYRTEIPFMTADRFPTEEEQRTLYRESMEAFDPRPVTMRTLDVGGDKALPYFPIAEDNPFLGWRGIRVTLDHPEILLVQVRAMIKASAGLRSDLRIMLPMITHLAEVDEALALVHRCYDEVVEEGLEVRKPEVGVMIEVPAAVYQARAIARRVDFLAIGSNDLTQYMLAVDRNNPRVADLYQDMHPAVLGAIRFVVDQARAEDTRIGICGEIAGNPTAAVLLTAMGCDVLSMNAPNLPRVKWALRAIDLDDARAMLEEVLTFASADEVADFMRKAFVERGLGRVVPPGSRLAGVAT
ncbi:MAG: phosphoenolpyruvate--protein phosphotransferase [Pseudomonadales bacterium]|jgi:phosphotransferase system enzyme I (PtsP)|nr:phosphoenolpyruvate--protein phosphotransferase [Pseudomonadales bacterium]